MKGSSDGQTLKGMGTVVNTQGMTSDWAWLVELLATTAAASVGAFISGRMGLIQADRSETTRLRRETAEELVTALSDLRRLLRDADGSRDVDIWSRTVDIAFDAISDAQHRLPSGWRHLKRSLRAAVGEAVGGVAFVDLHSAHDKDELATYDYRWTEYAMEYTDLVIDGTRRWRDARAKVARKMTLISYDDWLRRTGRYDPDGASQPGRRG